MQQIKGAGRAARSPATTEANKPKTRPWVGADRRGVDGSCLIVGAHRFGVDGLGTAADPLI